MLKIERIFFNSRPIAIIRNWAKNNTLPGFQSMPVYEVNQLFWQTVNREGLPMRAAAMSFNMFLAIPATFLFICSLLPYLPISKDFFSQLESIVWDLTPDKNTRKIIFRFLDDLFNKQKTGLLSLGFALTIFYASNAMMGIIRAFNRTVRNKPKPHLYKNRLKAIRLTLIIVLLLIGFLLISLGQGVIFSKIMKLLHIKNETIKALIKELRWVVTFFLFLYTIAFTYKYAPSIKKRGKLLTPGAFVATILIILCTSIFSYWAQNMSNYNKFYGSIGSVMLLMLLIYFNCLMLLIGYEINMSIRHLKEDKALEKAKNIY